MLALPCPLNFGSPRSLDSDSVVRRQAIQRVRLSYDTQARSSCMLTYAYGQAEGEPAATDRYRHHISNFFAVPCPSNSNSLFAFSLVSLAVLSLSLSRYMPVSFSPTRTC